MELIYYNKDSIRPDDFIVIKHLFLLRDNGNWAIARNILMSDILVLD